MFSRKRFGQNNIAAHFHRLANILLLINIMSYIKFTFTSHLIFPLRAVQFANLTFKTWSIAISQDAFK